MNSATKYRFRISGSFIQQPQGDFTREGVLRMRMGLTIAR